MIYDAVQFGAAGYPELDRNKVPADQMVRLSASQIGDALLIDPNPSLASEPWIPQHWEIEVCAWSTGNGTATLFVPSGNAMHPGGADGLRWELASLAPQRGNCERVRVVCKTFGAIAAEYGITGIKRLFTGIEGADALLIRDVLGCGIKPNVIFWESANLTTPRRDDLMLLLAEEGYIHTTIDKLNKCSVLT